MAESDYRIGIGIGGIIEISGIAILVCREQLLNLKFFDVELVQMKLTSQEYISVKYRNGSSFFIGDLYELFQCVPFEHSHHKRLLQTTRLRAHTLVRVRATRPISVTALGLLSYKF